MASCPTPENNPWQMLDKARNLKSTLVNQSTNVGNIIKSTTNAAGNKWTESSTVTKACIIGSATAVVAPLTILPVLSVVGFTSAGVAAGSIAASMQTVTTVSGSVFALCQSAAATAAAAASTSVGVSLGAGATAAGITAAVCRKKPRSQNNGNEAQVEIEDKEDVQEDGDEQCDSLEEKLEYKLHLKLSKL